MKMRKVLWGLLIIGAGLMLLLNALGVGEEYDVVRIIGSCILLGIAVTSVAKFEWILFFIPLAVIAYLWRIQLGFADLNIGLLLGAAVLLGIGLSIIVHKRNHFKHVDVKHDEWGKTEETLNENESVSVDASLGEHIKYIHAGNLKKAQIKSNFASVKVYFDQCQVSSEGLQIIVNSNFSETVLNVPKGWTFDNQVNCFAGAVTNVSDKTADGGIHVLLTGSVNFAELKVNYI